MIYILTVLALFISSCSSGGNPVNYPDNDAHSTGLVLFTASKESYNAGQELLSITVFNDSDLDAYDVNCVWGSSQASVDQSESFDLAPGQDIRVMVFAYLNYSDVPLNTLWWRCGYRSGNESRRVSGNIYL